MQTEHLKITGMTCGGCVSKVTHALQNIRGVSDVKVSLDSGQAAVQFDELQTSTGQLMSSVQREGYSVEADSGARGGKAKGGCCG